MKKSKILGISKQENRVSVVLKKEQKFVKLFRDFMGDLKFDRIYSLMDETDYREGGKSIKYDIMNEKDVHHWERNEEFDVDLVIGDKKIFLTVYSRKKDLQKGISEKIFKFCEFEESL